jgi:hypothetical protein
MKGLNKFFLGLIGGAMALWLFPAAVPSGAEVPPPHTIPTNLPGVYAFTEPPPNLNPRTASDEELAAWGFPPRPDATTAPEAYAAWARAVTAPARTIVPVLKLTDNYAGPSRGVRSTEPGTVIANPVAVTSSNWSGYVIQDTDNPFTLEAIQGDFIVPVAQQAFGNCTGSYDYGVAWVGIDGATINGVGSSDVLQAGAEFDADCSASTTTTYYAAWYEWYPNPWTVITNFSVSPGDDMSVEVWSTSATAGKAYLINYTTNVKVTISFSAPAGTTLVGDCVEWIVERPGIDGSLATLTNYIATAFNRDNAWNYTASTKTFYYPGSAPSGTIYSWTMLDNSGKPISYPTLEGPGDIWFYDEGSAL